MLTAVALATAPTRARAQAGMERRGPVLRPLSLESAVREAVRRNAELRIARARGDAARSEARLADSFLYPRIEAQSGYLRSPDPVAAFSAKLWQERFGAEDFEVSVLNDPAPVEDWTAGARVGWRALDPGRWQERAAARHGADAARRAARRAEDGARFRARVLYWDAVRADAQVRSTRRSEEAARANARRFRRRMEEGLLTRADMLQARAELRAAEARRVNASRLRRDARTALALHLGWSPDTLPVPTDTMAEPRPLTDARRPVAGRSDVRARAAEVDAARARQRAATFSYLPTVEAFGDLTAHAADPFQADGSHWSVGFAFRLPLFTGMRRPAERARAEAGVRVARTEYDRTLRTARAEVARARDAVEAARRAVDATRAAREAAAEGRDLMARRFEEGLATAADLLQAEARASDMRSRAIDALASYHVARARLDFARGTRPSSAADARADSNREENP